MRIAIVGAGVIGTIFAYIFGKVHDVTLVEVVKEKVDLYRREGYTIIMPDGKEVHVDDVNITNDPKEVGVVDLVQISVKGYATEAATKGALPMIGDETMVLSVQNGLVHDIIASVVGKEKVIAGITAHSGMPVKPNVIRYVGGYGPLLIIGKYDKKPNERFNWIVEELKKTGEEIVVVDDIEPVIWKKLVANVACNPVAAITGMTSVEALACEDTKALIKMLAEEVVEVARAKGIYFPEMENIAEFVYEAFAGTKDNKVSMLQDVENKRRTEIDTLNGAIVREGEKLGVDVKANKVITHIVKSLEFMYDKR
ncbi:2-dehydropantoate 2-reductase [Ferroglobus placidus DSM 10642]|uniref:2-dehydropantoate 2-reductase n=1 Tax=Ferroglobus placidus (strain DSM 10642 / AEDII12DO) TaxID=589924 RepID=D3RXH7_FERPA|nr:2-dehydropantoate 2-reductase [Ferroglobus placidus]ADC65190.1 2-dehydropantoate 2-reductase [Ferroglobus placidus DSM 10642]